MESREILKGKRILVVDDEPDILDTITELLEDCTVETANSYESAKKYLNKNKYDYAILDIMGVRGYDLLQIANQQGIPALMLTAHALDSDNFMKSVRSGATAYIPKENLSEIADFLADLIESQQTGNQKKNYWFKKLSPFFDNQFGPGWRKEPKDFWDNYLWLLSDE